MLIRQVFRLCKSKLLQSTVSNVVQLRHFTGIIPSRLRLKYRFSTDNKNIKNE